MDEMAPDPSQADLDYLASLDDQEDPLEQLQTRDEVESPEAPLSVCSECEFKHDRRSWWRRFFLPDGAQAADLSCKSFPRARVLNPITGKESYLPEGTRNPAYSQSEEGFPRCIYLNPIGTCQQFKPKITYRKL